MKVAVATLEQNGKSLNVWVTLISSVVFLGLLIAAWVSSLLTTPVGGKTLDRKISCSESEEKRLTQFEVFNPGPAAIDGYTFVVEVQDEYNVKTEKFSTGLLINHVGKVTLSYEPNGTNTNITVSPANEALRLNADRRFGVLIESNNANWQPENVTLYDGGSGEGVPIDDPMPEITRGLLSRWLWYGFLIFAVSWIYLYCQLRWKLMKNLDSQRHNLVADGYNDAIQELQTVPKMSHGKRESDPWEDAVRHLKAKKPKIDRTSD